MPSIEPSDVMLTIDLALAAVFALYFALGRPRVWHRDRLGWVIFSYALAVFSLLALIVFGIVFGQKVIEPVRFTVGTALAVALILKTRAVYDERHAGRRAGQRPKTQRKAVTMTNATPGADAPVIWYKGKRVLRTIVQGLIVAVPIANGVAATASAYLTEQTDVVVPGWVFLVLNGVIAASALLMGLVARVMAVPGVNDVLVKVGLGSVPASAIEAPGVVAPDPNTR